MGMSDQDLSLEAHEIADLPLRVSVARYGRPTGDELRMLKQLGVNDIILTRWEHDDIDSAMPVGQEWTVEDLRETRDRVNDAGLRLHAIQTMPFSLYDILLSDSDTAAEKRDVVKRTLRNMGEVGIPILGYSGLPPGGFGRTSSVDIRGGAEASQFKRSEVGDEGVDQKYTEEELWECYERFLQDVLPAAEEAGVTLALHPSDPPVESVNGIPLLFRDHESFDRAMDTTPSPNHGLKFCVGCWSQMGEDVPAVIRHFGDDIVYVHFRDVVGTVPEFHETFIDDPASNWDEFEVMEALDKIGFDGVVIPDHVPELSDEPEWEYGGLAGYSFTIGYLRAMIRSVQRE